MCTVSLHTIIHTNTRLTDYRTIENKYVKIILLILNVKKKKNKTEISTVEPKFQISEFKT